MQHIWRLVVVGAFILFTGAAAMAQEPAASAKDIQDRIDALKKQKELLDIEKQVFDAQKALVDAQKTPSAAAAATADQVAAANSAKALADAEKALADAEKAKSDAALAAFKGSIGEVPSSGISGTVTTSEKAGELEATLLATRAVREAAGRIGNTVREVLKQGGKVVLISASEVPTFQNKMTYEMEVALVTQALTDAIAAGTPPKGGLPEAVPLFGAAGLALEATSKLLSFFRTDFAISGVAITLEDRVAINEVARELVAGAPAPAVQGGAAGAARGAAAAAAVINVTVPLLYDPDATNGAKSFFLADLKTLSGLRQQVDGLIAAKEKIGADLSQLIATTTNAAIKKTSEDAAAANASLIAKLKSATGLMDAWYTKLATPDGKGVTALAAVAREKALADRIAGSHLLVLKVEKAGGGVLTKKNLWTVFGEMPLYHMGGAAVSFTLLEGQHGEVKAAGVVPVHGGFVKAGDVRQALGQ